MFNVHTGSLEKFQSYDKQLSIQSSYFSSWNLERQYLIVKSLKMYIRNSLHISERHSTYISNNNKNREKRDYFKTKTV